MLVFDASSIIHGWDNYPIDQFPGLWAWLTVEIALGKIAISEVAYDEVEARSPDCHAWLRDSEIPVINVTEEVLQVASAIKNMLGIQGDAYHPRGVGENDLLIIACARVHGHQLISDESFQTALPQSIKQYKIPAVCKHPSVTVVCMNFLAYIKGAQAVF